MKNLGSDHGRGKARSREALEREEAFRVLTEYSVAHPRTLAGLSRSMLNDPGETVAEQIEDVSAVVPFVRLPKPSG